MDSQQVDQMDEPNVGLSLQHQEKRFLNSYSVEDLLELIKFKKISFL